MNAERTSRIELLNSSNYEVWQIRMKAVLQRHDKWGYVSGSVSPPNVVAGDRTFETALNKWRENDEKAMAEIILSVGETELRSISKCTTSKEAWEKLQSIHASKSPVRKIELLTDITSFKMEDGDDFRERLGKFNSAVEQLEGMNIAIPSDMLVVLILKGLPASFENFRCAIRSKDELPSTETLIGKILDENKTRQTCEPTDDNNALYAGNKYGKGRFYNKQRQNNRFPCRICGGTDHWPSKCPKRDRNHAKNVDSRDENLYIEVAKSEEVKNVSSATRWCLDSGCTTHMCADESIMSDLKECSATLNMANSASTTARARGIAHVTATTNDGNVDLNLHNTLLVKDLRTNLISISKITQHDREVLFRRVEAIVRDFQGNVKLVADRIGELYYLREAGIQANTARIEESCTSTASLWHVRLGHLHMDAVVDLSRGRAKGIEPLPGGRMPCDVCSRGKMAAKPFTPREERSTELLEIVHSDLCQPSSTRSEGGNRYFATFIDDYSGWCEIYLLKSKDQVFEAFKEHKYKVEKQTGMKIKNLQSDNGREYRNSRFDEFLKREGIQRRLTTPYTPQQNGVAERMNRTIVDMARCLLIQSGLPMKHWGEAINTANYLRNRCPSRSHDGTTPYELWHKRVPNLKHLRVFGAKAFILIKGPGRQKLDDKSIEGRLVGYSSTAKAYRIRRNDTGKVEETRDVQIVEETKIRGHDDTHADIEYTHPEEDHQDQGRVTRSERAHEEPQMGPPKKRAPGRPPRIRTGKPGRPKKLYRYVSTSSIASDNASSRENLSQGEEEPQRLEQNDGEEAGDVFESEDDESRGEKRPLETSFVPVDKRARNDNNKSQQSSEDDPEDTAELTETGFIEESAFMSDINIREAMSGNEAQDWVHAIADEVRSHLEHGTWKLVDRPEGKPVIGSKLILKNKMSAEGQITRKKARIVARGFSQRPGLDYDQTFAPVARLDSIRLLAAFAAGMNTFIHQMDVVTAYLYGKINEELYMEVPDMLKEALEHIIRTERRDSPVAHKAGKMLRDLTGGNKVCQILMAIYGLKQSGERWYDHLRRVMEKIGLKPIISDPCLFLYRSENSIAILAAYVDDFLFISNDETLAAQIKRKLKSELNIKDLGVAEYCLGIELKQERGRISLGQSRYIEELLEKTALKQCNTLYTPGSPSTKLRIGSDPTRPTANPKYREVVGSLMYLSVATRPDISHSVSVLSQFNEDPNEEHWGAAKKVLRYLRGTSNKVLIYEGPLDKIVGYSDSNHGNDEDDSISYTGYTFKLGGAAISWKSKKQRSVSISSTEAEYRALTEATKESMYLRGLLGEIGTPELSDGLIYCDNQSAIQLTTTTKFHDRTKHVRIHFHFVREAVKNRSIHLLHIESGENVADILTKPLPRQKHEELTNALGVRSAT